MHFLIQNAIKGDSVLYCAGKNEKHLTKLIELFPELSWCIYSKDSMDELLLLPNVTVKTSELDSNEAETWKGKDNLLFINHSTTKCLHHQNLLVQVLQPKTSLLKMAHTVYDNLGNALETFEYLDGHLFLGAFLPPNSTDFTLVCTKNPKTKEYNSQQLKESAAFFHRIVRPKTGFDKQCMQSIATSYSKMRGFSTEQANAFYEDLNHLLLHWLTSIHASKR